MKELLKRNRTIYNLYLFLKYLNFRRKFKSITISKEDFKANYLKDMKDTGFLFAEDMAGYKKLKKDNAKAYADEETLKAKLSDFKKEGPFYVEWNNSLINENDLFVIEHKYMRPEGINFKEWIGSVKMAINARIRFTYEILRLTLPKVPLKGDDKIYIAEYDTPFYSLLNTEFAGRLIGSQYFGPNAIPGSLHNGIMHQDLEKLSFETGSLKYCMTFEDLEHVVYYKSALSELYRVLAPDGVLILSVPFVPDAEKTIERAYVDEKGEIVHILEPEMHGDPLNDAGILCFRNFGWELLEQLRALGFKHVKFITGSFPEKLIIGSPLAIVCSKELPI
jgi:SAM-dependent methyltransferase